MEVSAARTCNIRGPISECLCVLCAATGALVDVDKLNLRKYASRTGLAMVLTDYLLYVEHNTRKALELCAEATKVGVGGPQLQELCH